LHDGDGSLLKHPHVYEDGYTTIREPSISLFSIKRYSTQEQQETEPKDPSTNQQGNAPKTKQKPHTTQSRERKRKKKTSKSHFGKY